MSLNETKIEWCTHTWNPITGCRHGCDYCYARRQVGRFAPHGPERPMVGEDGTTGLLEGGGLPAGCYQTTRPVNLMDETGAFVRNTPYPKGFAPTLHSYKLDEPVKHQAPARIFVCSMADLFGDWVPDDWIMRVFDACCDVPRHRYLFLTKNPARYTRLAKAGMLPRRDNFWYGSTATTPDTLFWWSDYHNTFVSIEPMLEAFQPAGDCPVKKVDWIIMGAMSGPGSKDHQPKKEWINPLVEDAQALSVPVFMKDSLIPIVGEENMLRQFPWPTQTQKGAAQDAGVGVAQDTLMPAT